MAEIWFCYEGPEPTRGGPAYKLPIDECIGKLDISESTFLSDLPKAPKFQDTGGYGAIAGYKHVVLRLEQTESGSVGWKPGFYRVPLELDEVIERLGDPKDPFDIS